jgi:hypothetical protein
VQPTLLIVDGVHVPAVTSGRKTGGQRAFYSGKHKRHGLNVQTVCSPLTMVAACFAVVVVFFFRPSS